MSEIDLIQAYYGAVNLCYTTTTWWLTVSTALVVATYFAGKHIPAWLIAIVLALYAVNAGSVYFELTGYSNMAVDYAVRISELPGTHHGVSDEIGLRSGLLNSVANYGVVILGSIAAAAFSFVTWRNARKDAVKPIPIP
jgi:hypothetical protein